VRSTVEEHVLAGGRPDRPWHPFTRASQQPVTPNDANEYQIEIYPTSQVFKKGHQIRLTIGTADTPATSPPLPALGQRDRNDHAASRPGLSVARAAAGDRAGEACCCGEGGEGEEEGDGEEEGEGEEEEGEGEGEEEALFAPVLAAVLRLRTARRRMTLHAPHFRLVRSCALPRKRSIPGTRIATLQCRGSG